MNFLALIEPTATGFAATVPDLPGCIATGTNRDEVVSNITEAVQFHVDGMREDGTPIPEPTTTAEIVSVT
jgi:predicted RNase H-like HicB family nuclease